MGNFVRTETPDGDIRSFRYTNGSGVSKLVGTLYLIHDTWAIAFASDLNHLGNEGFGATMGPGRQVTMLYNVEKVMVAKAAGSGTAIAVGEKVYVDHVVKDVYNTNAGDRTCIGICTEAAAAAATQVEIDLKGDSMTDQP